MNCESSAVLAADAVVLLASKADFAPGVRYQIQTLEPVVGVWPSTKLLKPINLVGFNGFVAVLYQMTGFQIGDLETRGQQTSTLRDIPKQEQRL